MGLRVTGTLYGLGVGPGDPELITLKALRILRSCPIVAYPAPDNGPSFARSIVAAHLAGDQPEYPIVFPMRVERFPAQAVYDNAANDLAEHLEDGRDVAVLCEGDPFFYGSFMYLYERLAKRFDCEIIPGVSSLMAGAAALKRPLAARNDVLSVIPAPLPDSDIERALSGSDAVAIIKVGRHFQRIRDLIDRLGLLTAAGYLERISLENERVLPLADVEDGAPYFSLVLIYKGAENWVANLPIDTRAADRAGSETTPSPVDGV